MIYVLNSFSYGFKMTLIVKISAFSYGLKSPQMSSYIGSLHGAELFYINGSVLVSTVIHRIFTNISSVLWNFLPSFERSYASFSYTSHPVGVLTRTPKPRFCHLAVQEILSTYTGRGNSEINYC